MTLIDVDDTLDSLRNGRNDVQQLFKLALDTIAQLQSDLRQVEANNVQLEREKQAALDAQKIAEDKLVLLEPQIQQLGQLRDENQRLQAELADVGAGMEALNRRVAVAEIIASRAQADEAMHSGTIRKLRDRVRSLNGSVSYLTNLRVIEAAPEAYRPLMELLVLIARRAGYGDDIFRLAAHYDVVLPKVKGETPMQRARQKQPADPTIGTSAA
jgi:small-conductance mechanosensitive channel